MPKLPKHRDPKDRTQSVYFRLKETTRNRLAQRAVDYGETMQEIAERAILAELDRLEKQSRDGG